MVTNISAIAWLVCACMLSCFSHVQLCTTLWTAACQPSLSTGFSRQEYWSGCHDLLQRIFLTQGGTYASYVYLHWQVGSLPLLPPGKPHKPGIVLPTKL